jgi:hypothetical protein
MEHERGAFKVKLPDRPTQLRNGSKFMGSIPRAAADVPRMSKIPCQNFSQTVSVAQKIDSLPPKHTFFQTKYWAENPGIFEMHDNF